MRVVERAYGACPGLESLVGSDRASVPDLLRARVAATPDNLFLRWQGRTWSYAEALTECERFAGFLHRSGRAGERVAGYTANRPEAIWAWFGTQLAGGTYVPLNRSHRGAVLQDMLQRSGASVLVTDEGDNNRIQQIAGPDLKAILVAGCDPGSTSATTISYEQASDTDPWAGSCPRPEQLGMVMYTSGSTGRSKAVRLTHNQHARGAAHIATSFGMRGDDVWHGWAPLYHVFGQLYVVLGSVAAGASIALRPRFSLSGFWREIHESGATLIGALANMMRMVWALPDDEHSLTNPARLALAMGRFADLHRSFEQRYDLKVIDCYGLTEAEPLTLPDLHNSPPGTHGRPSPDFELAILDQHGRILPAGETGQIAARPRVPDVIFTGYEGDDDRTVEAWRDLWFHTGDVGLIDTDGLLHYLGRCADAIRRNGENVSAQEIETIAQQCPGVIAAAAVGIPAPDGEDEIKLTAVVDPALSVTPATLHAFCSREMAPFMVPRYIELTTELPVLDVGKVDRQALRVSADDVWDAREQADG